MESYLLHYKWQRHRTRTSRSHTSTIVRPERSAERMYFHLLFESLSPVHTKTIKCWKYDSVLYKACVMLVVYDVRKAGVFKIFTLAEDLERVFD